MSRPIWTGSASAPWIAPLAAVFAVGVVAFVVLTFTIDVVVWPGAIPLVLAALVTLPFREVTVRVERRELIVSYAGPIAPEHRIERRDIESAAVVDLRPLKWGGWGYRGSRLLFGRAAVLVRAGPGLEVVTANGKSLSISVDDPEGAVTALGF